MALGFALLFGGACLVVKGATGQRGSVSLTVARRVEEDGAVEQALALRRFNSTLMTLLKRVGIVIMAGGVISIISALFG
jgi:hypothetical protein